MIAKLFAIMPLGGSVIRMGFLISALAFEQDRVKWPSPSTLLRSNTIMELNHLRVMSTVLSSHLNGWQG